MKSRPILVIGATGYIGGRLVPLLIESGYKVRVLGRSLAKLCSRPWASHPLVEPMQGDALDPEDLKRAVEGCSAA
ncbi:MAG: SDR family oxidoreductase [Syntrophobacteraceae bacterium]